MQARISQEQRSKSPIVLDEFADKFYPDHPDKVAQQQRIDPVPDLQEVH
jgi:hypothetical protein